MLETKFCIPTEGNKAGKLYGIPYIISACTSPFLGYLVDRLGRRVLFITSSSVFLLAGYLVAMLLPSSVHPCTADVANYNQIIALVLIGLGFSVYAAALWPCIPYVVEAKIVGTAFGLAYSVQNAGLALIPTIAGLIHDATLDKDYGYFYELLLWVCMAGLGIVVSMILYFWDIRTGGVLNRVDRGIPLTDLLTSPTPEERREIAENPNLDENMKDYMLNRDNRNTLKRSMA
mmetsp:Transcript_41704/g.40061  ORF Transcript_41704/g.40061 Transcript_41704/m.40061 type:complete len:232 (+) Transcript_41704:17-712(+)